MAEWHVGSTKEFEEADRKLIFAGETKVGVFHLNGGFYAYENNCIHQGGPVCEGIVVGKVEAILEEDKNVINEVFNDEEMRIACPWHGYEFDIISGECAADRRFKLRKYEVVERDGMIYVID